MLRGQIGPLKDQNAALLSHLEFTYSLFSKSSKALTMDGFNTKKKNR